MRATCFFLRVTHSENSQNNVEDKKSVNTEKSKGGRPEKADSEKTEKTI